MLKTIIVIAGSSLFFRLGGWGKIKFLFFANAKWWRWLGVGYWIGAWYQNPWPVLTYLAATMIPYGENSYLNKFMSRDVKWGVYGLCFGLASMPVVGIAWSSAQAVIGAVTFWSLMKLSNDGINIDLKLSGTRYQTLYKLDHKWVEIFFPIGGLICLLSYLQ